MIKVAFIDIEEDKKAKPSSTYWKQVDGININALALAMNFNFSYV
jgi:hypothetical protein